MQRLQSFLTNYRISVPAIGVVLAGLAWLAFGYFGVHTLFVDEEVSEALPTFEAAPVEAEPAATDAAAATATPTDADGTGAETPADDGEAMSDPQAPAADDVDPPTGEPTEEPTDIPAEIVTELSGQFESDAHPTSGTAVVLGNGTGQRFLRFEDFRTDNGPDLNVYLVNSSTGDVSDYVDLGDLKGNIGEQNYEIAADVDLEVYDQVVIWCVRFGVGFGNAPLMAA